MFPYKSPLKQYILSKDSLFPQLFRLDVILVWFQKLLKENIMFDTSNPAIILFKDNLCNIFNTPWCHVTEFRPLVLEHIDLVSSKYQKMVKFLCPYKENMFEENKHKSKRKTLSKPTKVSTPLVDAYRISNNLRAVFETIPNFDKDKTVFKYKEICDYVSSYMLINRAKLLNIQNIRIAYVKDDLLGKAFQVDIFHRCQVTSLIRRQIHPV